MVERQNCAPIIQEQSPNHSAVEDFSGQFGGLIGVGNYPGFRLRNPKFRLFLSERLVVGIPVGFDLRESFMVGDDLPLERISVVFP